MDRLISEQNVFKIIDNLKANFTCYDSVTLDEVYSHVKDIPSAESSRDMKEIAEVMNCNADAETKCNMIFNIVYSKPHYFKTLEQKPKIEKAIEMRDATPEERESIDKYIKSISKPTGIDFDSLSDSQTIHHLTDKAYSELCLLAAKGREALQPNSDAVSRQSVKEQMIKYGFHAPDMTITEFIEDELPSVTIPQDGEYIQKSDVLDFIDEVEHKGFIGFTQLKRYVEELPSVAIPLIEPKTGYWIAQDIYNCHTNFKCSECGYIHSFMHLYGKPTADYTYCPNCGAKMSEIPTGSESEGNNG